MMKPLLLISIALLCARHLEAANLSTGVLSDQHIRKLIEEHRPSRGGAIPPDLKYRLGATHMDGQYCFTTEPYIIEGAKQVQGLGYGILKLWFAKADGNQRGYRYNSSWNLTKTMTFRDLAAHPYYQEVFAMPFKVFALNINEGFGGASIEDQTPTLRRIEQEFYELTKYLLTQYKTKEVIFILEMWEGDWTLRGGTGLHSKWTKDTVPANAPVRVTNMINWAMARQRGVDQARSEIGESRCKVYHAVEVNRVFDGLQGIPTLTTDVLPKVRVDMVSWSAYDGKSADGVMMYKGIDLIRERLIPSDYMKGAKVVFIGEINEHENQKQRTREYMRNFCDVMMGVYLAQKIPYIFYWELYGNETRSGLKLQDRNYSADELKGNWLIRPDGSHSWAQEYFDEILARSRP